MEVVNSVIFVCFLKVCVFVGVLVEGKKLYFIIL